MSDNGSSSERKEMNKVLCFGSLNIDYVYQVDHFVQKGDTFLGYFVASLLQGRDIAGSLRRASKAASIAISRVGAAPSIPWEREVSD